MKYSFHWSTSGSPRIECHGENLRALHHEESPGEAIGVGAAQLQKIAVSTGNSSRDGVEPAGA